jgi:hypothetical protein
MQMRRFATLFLLLSAWFFTASGCAGGTIVMDPWPAQIPEDEPVVVQFIDLAFRLPRSMVGRVVVLGVNSPNLTILRNPDNSNDLINIGKKEDFWEVYETLKKEGFFDGLDIHDAESFFDSLAVSPGTSASEPLNIMRDAFQVKGAEYTKSVKEKFVVYRIVSRRPGANKLYILIDGNETVYELTGDISDHDYKALLSGMSISKLY